MADDFIGFDESATIDKKLDTESLVVGANTVHRERMQIAGAAATAIAGCDAANGLDVDVTRVTGTVTVDSELPAAAALADAAANPTTPTVGSGLLEFNGTTWDRVRGDTTNGIDVDVTRVTGTVTVDTELAAAAALADATANPTIPSIGADILLFNGTTWDRVRGDITNGLDVDVTRIGGNVTVVQSTAASLACEPAGNVAHDAADSGNPVKVGAKASTSLAGLTLVANADRTDLFAGVDGALIIRPYCNLEDIVSGVAGITDGSSTSVIAAQGAGIKVYITSVIIANSSASNVTVDLRDGAAGAVKGTFPAPANGGVVHALPVPLPFSANTLVAADPSAAATTVTVTLIGFKSKI